MLLQSHIKRDRLFSFLFSSLAFCRLLENRHPLLKDFVKQYQGPPIVYIDLLGISLTRMEQVTKNITRPL